MSAPLPTNHNLRHPKQSNFGNQANILCEIQSISSRTMDRNESLVQSNKKKLVIPCFSNEEVPRAAKINWGGGSASAAFPCLVCKIMLVKSKTISSTETKYLQF